MKILISIGYLKSHRQKNLSFSYYTTTNVTGYKLPRQLRKQPKDKKSSMLAPFIRRLTNLRKKVLSRLTGETKDEKREEEPAGDITKSQKKDEQSARLSKPYEISCESGSQLSPDLDINEKTWVSEYITCFVAYSFFSKQQREEWMGDIYEINYDLLSQGKPRYFVNLVDFTRTLFFVLAKLKITARELKDFLKSIFYE